MKNLLFFLCCIIYSSVLNAQQLEVISSGGDNFVNSQGSISFSIGEIVIETIAHGDLCLTQGFCQSNLLITAIGNPISIDYQLLVYPNPVTDFVCLKIGSNDLSNFKYALFDVNGKILIIKQIVSNETIIPFGFLSPSTYFLKIIDNKTEIKTFKIIKSN